MVALNWSPDWGRVSASTIFGLYFMLISSGLNRSIRLVGLNSFDFLLSTWVDKPENHKESCHLKVWNSFPIHLIYTTSISLPCLLQLHQWMLADYGVWFRCYCSNSFFPLLRYFLFFFSLNQIIILNQVIFSYSQCW